jgi:phosphoribosyl 1,2-cyclic phosphodiesterase
MSLRIKLFGVRGSLPTPTRPSELQAKIKELFIDFFDGGNQGRADVEKYLSNLPPHRYGGFGGNTPCIDVSTSQHRLIIDGGSGLRLLGYELMKGPCGRGEGEVHLFFTHFHWDHLIGLPFFTPFFIKGNRIHVYAVQQELPEVFKVIFKKPYFPLELHQLSAHIEYHQLEARKPFKHGDMTLTPYQLDHPDPCWGYKIVSGGKVFSHCVDTECERVTRDQLGLDLPLYQGVDLMIFDAQYTLMEAIEKVNWGHASATFGLDIAMREGVKQVLFMHHDPASSDEKIFSASTQAKHYYMGQHKEAARSNFDGLQKVSWSFAVEGMVIDI